MSDQPSFSFGEVSPQCLPGAPAAAPPVGRKAAGPSKGAELHRHAHRDRLRARFSQGGAEAVPDYELLEMILYRALRAHRIDTTGFIWNPIRFHHLLVPAARRGFLPWFYVGGAGFVVVVLGLVLLIAAMFSVFMRGI